MTGIRKRIRDELDSLVKEGYSLLNLSDTKNPLSPTFSTDYQRWYTRSLAALRQLLPDRLDEFVRLYTTKLSKAGQISSNPLDYGIDLYLLGARTQKPQYPGSSKQVDIFNHESNIAMRTLQQIRILASALSRIEDILSNISGVLEANLFDSQLDAARALLKNGHIRAAGTVAAVVLEAHLGTVASAHSVSIRAKNPVINDYNEAFKAADIIDVPVWRNIQRLADIRNYCVHKKEREPTPSEVVELIDGVEKITKTLL